MTSLKPISIAGEEHLQISIVSAWSSRNRMSSDGSVPSLVSTKIVCIYTYTYIYIDMYLDILHRDLNKNRNFTKLTQKLERIRTIRNEPHRSHGPLRSSLCPSCPVLSAQWKRKFGKPDFLSAVGNGRWGVGTQCPKCLDGPWWTVKTCLRCINLEDIWAQIKLCAGCYIGGAPECVCVWMNTSQSAGSGSTRFGRFWRRFRRFRRRSGRLCLVQSQVRFNRVPEKVLQHASGRYVKTLRVLGIPPKLIAQSGGCSAINIETTWVSFPDPEIETQQSLLEISTNRLGCILGELKSSNTWVAFVSNQFFAT